MFSFQRAVPPRRAAHDQRSFRLGAGLEQGDAHYTDGASVAQPPALRDLTGATARGAASDRRQRRRLRLRRRELLVVFIFAPTVPGTSTSAFGVRYIQLRAGRDAHRVALVSGTATP
jgi:hypothetical protein